jgi:hypothetical protein
MFQICVLDQKVQGKESTSRKTYLKWNDYEHQNSQYFLYYWNFKIYGT